VSSETIAGNPRRSGYKPSQSTIVLGVTLALFLVLSVCPKSS